MDIVMGGFAFNFIQAWVPEEGHLAERGSIDRRSRRLFYSLEHP